jgi:hypothetical protein
MNKATTFVLFLSIMVISLMQCCDNRPVVATGDSTGSKDSVNIYESKDTVAIYLASVKRKDGHGKDSYHLAMFDANGDWGIDTLVTIIKIDPSKDKSGNIRWIKVVKSGIKRIIEIKSLADSTIIFKNGTYEHPHGVWNLNLPKEIYEHPGKTIEEEYLITYIPEDKDTTIIIDPMIRVPPPPKGGN